MSIAREVSLLSNKKFLRLNKLGFPNSIVNKDRQAKQLPLIGLATDFHHTAESPCGCEDASLHFLYEFLSFIIIDD